MSDGFYMFVFCVGLWLLGFLMGFAFSEYVRDTKDAIAIVDNAAEISDGRKLASIRLIAKKI